MILDEAKAIVGDLKRSLHERDVQINKLQSSLAKVSQNYNIVHKKLHSAVSLLEKQHQGPVQDTPVIQPQQERCRQNTENHRLVEQQKKQLQEVQHEFEADIHQEQPPLSTSHEFHQTLELSTVVDTKDESHAGIEGHCPFSGFKFQLMTQNTIESAKVQTFMDSTNKHEECQAHLSSCQYSSLKDVIRKALLQWNKETGYVATLEENAMFSFTLNIDGSTRVQNAQGSCHESINDEDTLDTISMTVNEGSSSVTEEWLEPTSAVISRCKVNNEAEVEAGQVDNHNRDEDSLDQTCNAKDIWIDWSRVKQGVQSLEKEIPTLPSVDVIDSEIETSIDFRIGEVASIEDISHYAANIDPTFRQPDIATRTTSLAEGMERSINDEDEVNVSSVTNCEVFPRKAEKVETADVEIEANDPSEGIVWSIPRANVSSQIESDEDIEEASVINSEIEWNPHEKVTNDVDENRNESKGEAQIGIEEGQRTEEATEIPTFDWIGARPMKVPLQSDSEDEDTGGGQLETDRPQGKRRRSRRALFVDQESDGEPDDYYGNDNEHRKHGQKYCPERKDSQKKQSSSSIIHPKKTIKDAKKKYKDAKNMFTSFFIEGDKKATSSRKLFDPNGNSRPQRNLNRPQRNLNAQHRGPRYHGHARYAPNYPPTGRGAPPGYFREPSGYGRRPPPPEYYRTDPRSGYPSQNNYGWQQPQVGPPMRRPPPTHHHYHPQTQRVGPSRGMSPEYYQPPQSSRQQPQRSHTVPQRSFPNNAVPEAPNRPPTTRYHQSNRSRAPPMRSNSNPRPSPTQRQQAGQTSSFDGYDRNQRPSTVRSTTTASRPKLQQRASSSTGRKATLVRRQQSYN